MTSPKNRILIDSSGVLHRMFHGRPPFTVNIDGEQVNIAPIRAYLAHTAEILNEFSCDELVHVLDYEGGSEMRKREFPEYKAQRSPTDPELTKIKKVFRRALEAFGQRVLEQPGVEADDLIGSLAKQYERNGDWTLIVSQDKDLMQLVGEQTAQMRTVKNAEGRNTLEMIDADDVVRIMGVRPDQIVDLLAICGDTADNIPGIPGVGKKTAQAWLEEHGTIETLITQSAAIKGAMGNRLREHQGVLPLYQKLTATINDLDVTTPGRPEPEQSEKISWHKHLRPDDRILAIVPDGFMPEQATHAAQAREARTQPQASDGKGQSAEQQDPDAGPPRVWNKHHNNAPAGAVYIGRGSPWGNPYTHREGTRAKFVVASREEAVSAYERSLTDGQKDQIRKELAGKHLVCFCAPNACHGDVLLRIANNPKPNMVARNKGP